MENNCLLEIPDFSNVSTLMILNLDQNKINVIPSHSLDQLNKLTTLKMVGNNLETIPDVSGPGKTLKVLSLSENHFTEFPEICSSGESL